MARTSDCPGCGTGLPRWARFCARCGAAAAHRPSTVVAADGRRDGARAALGRATAAAAGLVTALLIVATFLGTDSGAPSRADAEPFAATVEVPRPEGGGAGDGPDDAHHTELQAQRATHPPPACLANDGSACAEPLLEVPDVIGAVHIAFGAVVVDSSLTVRRLHLIGDRPHLRWRADLAGAVVDGERRAAAPPTQSRLERSGTTLLLGTPSHLHALGSIDGQQRWSTRLDRSGDGTTPWHGWLVDDAVLAVGPSSIVALDADDGSLRWRVDGVFQDVLPLASGVAVIRAGQLAVFTPVESRPRWSRAVDGPARFPLGLHPPNHGPVVVTAADERTILDPDTGEVLAELGASTVVTRTTTGQVVAALWEDDLPSSTLVGFGIDGVQRWRADGPEVPCCQVQLRPTADGRAIALFPGGAGTESGWVIDATTGSVTQRVTRPADVAWVPRAVVDSTVVWMDGAAFVAADPGGTPRWRAESQARLLSASPLLLSTRDGLIRPPPAPPPSRPVPRLPAR